MSNRLSKLLNSYESHISIPWNNNISAEERAIFVVYPKEDELKLRLRIGEFEAATSNSGHDWQLLNLTDHFAQWMAEQDYKEAYFEDPEYLKSNYSYFAEELAEKLKTEFKENQNENSVVAVIGCGALFGIASVSALVKNIASDVEGRLVVFFPGEHYENSYRLLDAKDGWGYQAIAITIAQ